MMGAQNVGRYFSSKVLQMVKVTYMYGIYTRYGIFEEEEKNAKLRIRLDYAIRN